MGEVLNSYRTSIRIHCDRFTDRFTRGRKEAEEELCKEVYRRSKLGRLLSTNAHARTNHMEEQSMRLYDKCAI